jgi:dTDP-4-dehydrorhamnose 3,5-epimerase
VKIEPTSIPGLFQVSIMPHADERGLFARTYCAQEFEAAGTGFGPIRQTSLSANARSGTLRGMHWQAAPAREGKLVRPARGRIFDAVVDLRPDSPAFKRWYGKVLDAALHDALLIPPLCAHGFLTLEDETLVEYAMDCDFSPEHSRGVRYDDPAFDIQWPAAPAVISERDRSYPDFSA